MVNKICFFDLLPVELIHIIFNYFLAHDILLSFTNVSNGIDTILLAYSSYRLNFKSISKANFDRICRQIRPDQVLSLTLSDDDDTPGQSKLFLSHFRIEQFIQLQSLTLFNIEIEALELILPDLNKLDQLISFSFHTKTIQTKYPFWINDYTNMVTRLNHILSEVNTKMIPRLNRLSLNDAIALNTTSFERLRCLILLKTRVNELQMIFNRTSELKSLNVCLNGDISNIESLHPSSELTRLTLTIVSPMSMDQIERFLPNFPYLKYLTLKIKDSGDLGDGHRWERLSVDYVIFNFKIQITLENIEQTFDSFSTSFWLQEKRWYVAYHSGFLFSVPKFAPKYVDNSYNPQYFTAPDKTFLYNNITKLGISASARSNSHSFDHTEMLQLQHYGFSDLFSRAFNIGQQQYNSHSLSNKIQLLLFYLRTIPRCYKLSFTVDSASELINKLSGKRFKQIRNLEIHSTAPMTRPIIEEILHMFPRVECLLMSSITSNVDMIRLIDGFKYLSNAHFIIQSDFTENERNWFYKPELSIYGVRRLKNGSFTCRFNRSSISSSTYSVHVWINRQAQQSCWIRHWPPRSGYLWYRLIHFMTLHPDVTWSK